MKMDACVTGPEIREATVQDVPTILRFIKELAAYEKAEHQVVATESKILETLFVEQATSHALVCEVNGASVGFAVYFFNYSTWQGQYGLYLEDLYVSPECRGSGAGKALLKHLAQLAVAKNCGRFEWNVLDWNEPAIQFYQSIGAKPKDGWVGYRLAGDALHAFANG